MHVKLTVLAQVLSVNPTAVPDLVADLVGLGVRVHAVEPARITLEERLLDILRTGSGGDGR
jgi:ABC-2 type transport system ATP-binding protein